VAVDHRPLGKDLIRRGWYLARGLKGALLVVHVRPPGPALPHSALLAAPRLPPAARPRPPRFLLCSVTQLFDSIVRKLNLFILALNG